MKTEVKTDKAPAPIGPYSQAIKTSSGLIFLSGQIPFSPEGELAGDDIKSQTKRVFENIKVVLEEAGCGFENVVKTTVFLKNMDDFAAMNEVYAEYFGETPPARSAIQAAKLPKDVLVEIETIAEL